MDLLAQMAAHDHEQIIAVQNRSTGLRAFLAIHDTTLGPALGGTRIFRYSTEAQALADALRLSRAMTYKASLAELPCGGGKIVVMEHDGMQRAEAFEALGRVIENLNGRFFTGEDVGTTPADLAAIARSTRYVACGSSPELGNISEHTAIGVWHGMRACLEAAGVKHARVAIQGLGSVGMALARILRREGLDLLVADIVESRAREAERELGARVVAPEEILFTECDVLAPCALGGVLSAETAPRLRARIVCGSANNQLAAPEAADALAGRGILYAPDYLVNAGGLVRGAEFYLLGRKDSLPSLARIYERMQRVLAIAREKGVSTARVADELAEARLKPGKSFANLTWTRPLPPACGCG